MQCSFISFSFFFFKQKTAYEMRISDWSSDVCSSDLAGRVAAERSTRRASERAAVMLETVREPIVLADEDLRVVMYSAAFTELFGVEGDAIGQPLADVGGHAWNDEETLRRLGEAMARDRELGAFQRHLVTADRCQRVVLVHARRVARPVGRD